MSFISIAQNNPRQLERLAAQRQLYATAKRLLVAQIVLSGPIALVSVLLARAYPETAAWVALWGFIVLLVDAFGLSPWMDNRRANAARIQELFDCEALGLTWNKIKAGNPPEPELIKEQADAYANIADTLPPLRDWYPIIVDCLPIHLARLVCQRSNCSWDAGLRRRYAGIVLAALVLVCVLVLAVSFQKNYRLQDFVMTVLAPLAPAVRLGYRQIRENRDAARTLDELKRHLLAVWNSALDGQPEEQIAQQSRDLQDEIFHSRRHRPPVFDAVFNILRGSFQTQMDYAAVELVEEAKRRLGVLDGQDH